MPQPGEMTALHALAAHTTQTHVGLTAGNQRLWEAQHSIMRQQTAGYIAAAAVTASAVFMCCRMRMERTPTYQSHLRSNKLFDQDNVRYLEQCSHIACKPAWQATRYSCMAAFTSASFAHLLQAGSVLRPHATPSLCCTTVCFHACGLYLSSACCHVNASTSCAATRM